MNHFNYLPGPVAEIDHLDLPSLAASESWLNNWGLLTILVVLGALLIWLYFWAVTTPKGSPVDDEAGYQWDENRPWIPYDVLMDRGIIKHDSHKLWYKGIDKIDGIWRLFLGESGGGYVAIDLSEEAGRTIETWIAEQRLIPKSPYMDEPSLRTRR